MNYAIIGSRTFQNYELLKIVCDKLVLSTDTIISGAARGADILGKQYAIERNLNYIEFPADWTKHGKRAGFIRNKDIIDNSHFVIAFWDGVSNGTKDSLNLAKLNKIPTLIVYY